MGYDNDFRVGSLSVNGGDTIGFAYDADGLLTQSGALAIDRDPLNGLITGTTLGSVSDTLSYNGFGEIDAYRADFSGTALYEVQYSRDALGRVVQKVETIGGVTNTYDYTYDATGHLTGVNKNGVSIAAYTYDANGNRLSSTNPGGTAGSYDAQDRLISYGSKSYTYTANGELQSRTDTPTGGTVAYNYDVLGNLLGVISPDGTMIEYIVDGTNRRTGKKVNGVLMQGLLYKDQLNPIAELDGVGNVVSVFVYGTMASVPDYMVKGGVTYRIISDHLGSLRLVMDATTGAIVQRLDYDEFGNIIQDTNPGFQPFGFAGGLYDPDTGLTRFGARDYDSETGRWTARDPILFAGKDTNLYGYVQNDPINFIDPEGLLTIPFTDIWIPAGEEWGEGATMYYAGITTDPCASGWEKTGAWIGGSFASLWTPQTSDYTLATLASAYSLNQGLKNVTFDLPSGTRRFQIRSRNTGEPYFRVDKGPVPGKGTKWHYHRRPDLGKHRPWQGW